LSAGSERPFAIALIALGAVDVAVLDLVLAPRLARQEAALAATATAGAAGRREEKAGPAAPPPVAPGGPQPAAVEPSPAAPGPSAARPITMDEVHFAPDDDTIDAGSAAQLKALVAALRRLPGKGLRIRGHADRRGASDYNRRLSELRAAAVVRFLIARGVAKERLHIEAVGEDEPADPGRSAEALARNRRVQLIWK
jgi:outer membrane protein OmpA-like peptidoglycan-associated protein